MSFPKILIAISIVLFCTIGVTAVIKKEKGKERTTDISRPIEIALENTLVLDEEEEKQTGDPEQTFEEEHGFLLSDTDRVEELFSTRGSKLPIVQTITYKSKVPWLKGRPAWVVDYASHYKTSRHFIARSLNGELNYEKQDIKEGDRFNVFNNEKNFEFYLLIDLLSSQMGFYYFDNDSEEYVLLKTYPVGLGRPDPSSPSGFLTPIGKYSLGNKIAIYKPNTMSYYQGEKIEMVRVFGTRWIPFGEELTEDCTAPARGLGIHGLPLKPTDRSSYEEDLSSLGKYESDGCIRMATKDMEELFSIIITKPTTVELVSFAGG